MAKAELEEVFDEDEAPVAKPKKAKLKAIPPAQVKGIKKRVVVEEDDSEEEEAEERQPAGQRGVKDKNLFQVLRESFSAPKGLTIEEAVEVIREATEGVKARNGKKYPEALMIGRVRKFLAGARIDDEVEIVSEKNGQAHYRYTGEVNVKRGRDKQTVKEKAANPPKKVGKPVVKMKVKAKPVVEDEEEGDEEGEE